MPERVIVIDEYLSDADLVQVTRTEAGRAMRCRPAHLAGDGGWREIDDVEDLAERVEQLVAALRAAGVPIPIALPESPA